MDQRFRCPPVKATKPGEPAEPPPSGRRRHDPPPAGDKLPGRVFQLAALRCQPPEIQMNNGADQHLRNGDAQPPIPQLGERVRQPNGANQLRRPAQGKTNLRIPAWAVQLKGRRQFFRATLTPAPCRDIASGPVQRDPVQAGQRRLTAARQRRAQQRPADADYVFLHRGAQPGLERPITCSST